MREKKLTKPIRICDDNIFRSELGEELLKELQRRIILHGQRGLIHINAEIKRIVPSDCLVHHPFLRKGRDRRDAVRIVTVRGGGVESHNGICLVCDDTQSVFEFVGPDVPEHSQPTVFLPQNRESPIFFDGHETQKLVPERGNGIFFIEPDSVDVAIGLKEI